MFHSMRRLSLTAAGVAAGLMLASFAQAATISFTSDVYSQDIRSNNGGAFTPLFNAYTLSGGIPDPPIPHTALRLSYGTSGLDYVVDKVTFTVPGGNSTTFVAPGDGTPITLPSTIVPPGGSTGPAGGLTTIGGGGKSLSYGLSYGSDTFEQGFGNDLFTYVETDNGSGEMTGTGPGLTANAHDLLKFNGVMVDLHFIRDPRAGHTNYVPGVFSFDLSSAYSIDTNGPGVDPSFHNHGQAGNTIAFNLVPEPGTVALFLSAGISGSGLLLRRRRK